MRRLAGSQLGLWPFPGLQEDFWDVSGWLTTPWACSSPQCPSLPLIGFCLCDLLQRGSADAVCGQQCVPVAEAASSTRAVAGESVPSSQGR